MMQYAIDTLKKEMKKAINNFEVLRKSLQVIRGNNSNSYIPMMLTQCLDTCLKAFLYRPEEPLACSDIFVSRIFLKGRRGEEAAADASKTKYCSRPLLSCPFFDVRALCHTFGNENLAASERMYFLCSENESSLL